MVLCATYSFIVSNVPVGDHGGTGGPFRSEHRVGAGVPVNGVERCRLLPGRSTGQWHDAPGSEA